MHMRAQRVRVAAPRELLFEVIASAGKIVDEAESGRLVEFETEWQGRVFKTVEAVTFECPERITYKWVTGPLVGVEEEIVLHELDPQTTDMTYRGSFRPPSGILGWFRGLSVVRPIFNRLAREHLHQAKRLAETRALRSRRYPRNGDDNAALPGVSSPPTIEHHVHGSAVKNQLAEEAEPNQQKYG